MPIEVDDAIRGFLLRSNPSRGSTSQAIYHSLSSEVLEHLNPGNQYLSLVSHLSHMVRRGEVTSNDSRMSGERGKRFKIAATPDPKPPSRYDRLMGDDELDLAGVRE